MMEDVALRPVRWEPVLIGPHRTGKSTLAGLLAARLGVPHVALDRLKASYLGRLGFDAGAGQRLRVREGFHAFTQHLKPYVIAMVEQVLAEYHDCVFDFGAGHSLFDDPEHVARLRTALAAFDNVVLILPSPDAERSIRILHERSGPWVADGTPYFDFPAHEVRHSLNRLLATAVVYTDGQTPEKSCTAIRARLRRLDERAPRAGEP